MSVTADLLAGIAGEIEAPGIAIRSDVGWTAGQTAITYALMPADPDRVVTLTIYGASDHPSQPLGSVNLQVRSRGVPEQPLDVDALDDAVFAVLQGLTDRTYGSAHVIQVLRKSSMPLGVDANSRWERSSNYVLDVDYPATPLRND